MSRLDATLTPVTDSVFAWLQRDGSWWVNNAGAIGTSDGIVIIDTCATERRTHALLEAVAEATRGAPIIAAINTHQHGDHTYGNSLLPSATVVIGHENTRDGLLADTIIDGCPPFWYPVPDWGRVTLRPPTITIKTSLSLHHGDRHIEVHHPGYPAHTTGDLVAWVPDQRVLFVGDLLFHRVTPLVFMGSLDGALRVLDWIAEFDPAFVVPGHGPLVESSKLPGVLDAHRRYFRLVLHAAEEGLREGLTPLAAARRCELGSFVDMLDAERIVLNVHRAYADSAGADLDLYAAFRDAVSFHGGPMRTAV